MAQMSVQPLQPLTRLASYEVIAPIKGGGMATLYLAKRAGPAGFERHVAIKVVHPHLAQDPNFVEMFLAEARLSARIQHPNVVHVEELGEENGAYYLVMEYVHGASLGTLLKTLAKQQRAFQPSLAVWIGVKVAAALHAAHTLKNDAGEIVEIVHRDVSPQNVLISYAGHVKLIDFGIAKISNQNTMGSLKGKIGYMAPEQAWGKPCDRRADVYALGIVVWEMLTRRRRFAGKNDFALLEKVRSPRLIPPSKYAPEVEALDPVVLKALSPAPDDRYPTAKAFGRALLDACPQAMRVDAEDLGLLMTGVIPDDDRQIPVSVSGALSLPTPTSGRVEAAIHKATIQASGIQLLEYDDSGGSSRSLSIPDLGTGRRDDAPDDLMEVVREEKARRRRRALGMAGAGVLAFGVAVALVLAYSPEAAPVEPPHPATVAAASRGQAGPEARSPRGAEAPDRGPTAEAVPAGEAIPAGEGPLPGEAHPAGEAVAAGAAHPPGVEVADLAADDEVEMAAPARRPPARAVKRRRWRRRVRPRPTGGGSGGLVDDIDF